MTSRRAKEDRPPPIVRYAPLGELKVYEVSEAELERLEAGPPGQLHLNFAFALLPAALTILITLLTVDIKDNRVFYGFFLAFLVFAVEGLISLVRWRLTSRAFKALVSDIRSRMPERPGIPEQVTGPADGGTPTSAAAPE
jgi:hypothetical protein